ncbi:mitochondrial inner membrane protease subunit 1-like [Haliotis rubra]|uniref:mitochondrial inner membrane protease subunit 1-like n=1 Tax=Haliotis rubra TaxID=36100 RepID=UPI001EE5287C|nr:mitochondrial inner membrane protease subunit 1-like [Haliotis rubra]XP_046573784.1 mitochondrial inner membrane protease subunit 1-like [Haliotis rubra]
MFRRVLGKSAGVLFYFVQYGAIAHCALEFGGDFVVCSGPSMEPTIQSGDVVLTEHISTYRTLIQKGDVVITRSPVNPHYFLCKRVVGLAGDNVFNGTSQTFKRIPPGHVWLEGDNKDNSSDSREYGPVPYALIRSRVFFKIWPPRKMGTLTMMLDQNR